MCRCPSVCDAKAVIADGTSLNPKLETLHPTPFLISERGVQWRGKDGGALVTCRHLSLRT